ncbi:HNH endonuclease [Vibrio cholerae]|nr:HNH endonuclease [Vibrio cholerae]EJL7013013.1 HNH endonuclease [Vibrio cholerae]EKF9252526.1 HNH endonuclease [Vibrio cholerae]EKF9270354.1 HNH endonuclease [Vibrio cholerae]ELH5922401.1 HNH endonuclease [Vibrio cholerae]
MRISMIKFEIEFVNYLVNRRNAVTLDTANSYVSYLKRVDKQLFGVDFHTLSCVDDIKNLVFGLRATRMPEGSIKNCDVAMRAYLKFLNKVIHPERLFPEESEKHIEGASISVKVNRFERNLQARLACIAHHGVTCAVCRINFGEVYGDIGVGFIHVHHVTPLSEIKQEYSVDPIKDLVPVCPNCHAMLHRKIPPYTVSELKEIIEK